MALGERVRLPVHFLDVDSGLPQQPAHDGIGREGEMLYGCDGKQPRVRVHAGRQLDQLRRDLNEVVFQCHASLPRMRSFPFR